MIRPNRSQISCFTSADEKLPFDVARSREGGGIRHDVMKKSSLRLHGMSWGVKTTCFKAPGVSLGGSGVSIGGVRSLRVIQKPEESRPLLKIRRIDGRKIPSPDWST